MPASRVPTFAGSLLDRASILDPYSVYRTVRELGSVVWLRRHRAFAVARYDDVRAVLRTDATFVSGRGVTLSSLMNAASARRVATLVSDGEQHARLRRLVSAPLRPRGLGEIRKRMEHAARTRVEALVDRGVFDAMSELASHLPVTVVAELVGLHRGDRERMLEWSRASFNTLGALNGRSLRTLPRLARFDWTSRRLRRENVRSGSWLAELFEARNRGKIDALEMAGAVMDYIAPSLDTTIMAIGHLLHRLAGDRAAWEKLRDDPSLVPGAVAEALRIDSPVKMLTRSTATATQLGGVALPRHARVVVMYAAANRDPRRYTDPDRFEITRDARDHLAFGHGAHACVGAGLAQIELEALLRALLERVAVLEAGPPRVLRNNALYGFERLPLRLVPAQR